MESLVQYYIQEAKEGIEVDGEIINLLNKKNGDIIIKKHGLTNQLFAQLVKSVMDYYDTEIAGKKASDFITELEIKAKFPESKYIQDIVVRSYLCHVLETSKEIIDDFYSDDAETKKEATKDLALNLAIVQLKKIYKINSLKFAKIFKKDETQAISAAEIKETKKNLEIQLQSSNANIIPDEVKDLIIDKNEKIKPTDLKNIKQEIQKIDVKVDETAVKNVNKYLFAISETFNFLKLHLPKLSLKNIKASERMIEKAYEAELKEKDVSKRILINKIKEILNTLGRVNTFSIKENFEEMNVLAWSYNVINLKAYHTGFSDFEQITKDVEKKVVTILHKYQPAQRNSYDAYHLVEDFIEICRDQTGTIKISHNITDLMLTQILKDYMQKAYDDVNNILRVNTKLNKIKAIEVKKNEQGEVTQIVNPEKTEKQRKPEIQAMISDLAKNVSKAREFFFNLYNGNTTFNNKRWENLDRKTQDQIMKNAKINRNSAEYLELKLNKKIEKVTSVNPTDRENKIASDIEAEMKANAMSKMSSATINFINQFKSKKEDYRIKFKNKLDDMQKLIDNYEKTGIINKKITDIFDKNSSFEYKMIDFAKIIPANGNLRNLLINDSVETPILNKYIGLINENK
jgi:hypothetical protein